MPEFTTCGLCGAPPESQLPGGGCQSDGCPQRTNPTPPLVFEESYIQDGAIIVNVILDGDSVGSISLNLTQWTQLHDLAADSGEFAVITRTAP